MRLNLTVVVAEQKLSDSGDIELQLKISISHYMQFNVQMENVT